MKKINAKKSGFTLVELMVTIGLTGILLLGLSSALIYSINMSNGTISSASTLLQVQTLRDYIYEKSRSIDLVNENFKVVDNKTLYFFGNSEDSSKEISTLTEEEYSVLFKNTKISEVTFDLIDELDSEKLSKKIKKCTIKYDLNSLEFTCYYESKK